MGKELFQKVVDGTGLPQDPVSRELKLILGEHGKSPETLTLEELREVMAEYLQSVILEAKANY